MVTTFKRRETRFARRRRYTNPQPAPKRRVHLMRALRARAQARALLLFEGQLGSLNEALGPLYQWAAQKGLARRYGEETVKRTIEQPFIAAWNEERKRRAEEEGS